MKLEQIKNALDLAESRFGIDGVDLKILGEWLDCKRQCGFATIMFFINESKCASQATTHARIKKLCDKNILKKVDNPANLRYKHLEKGSEFDKLVKLLEKV